MRYELQDPTFVDPEQTNGHVVAKGECIYNPDSQEVRNVELNVMEFSWWARDGEKRLALTHFKRLSANVSVSASLDRKTEPPA